VTAETITDEMTTATEAATTRKADVTATARRVAAATVTTKR
jgi:hypothetical protein